MNSIQSKLPDLGTTIFTVMSQLANEYQAINLGQGFPDFGMDEELQQLVYNSMQSGNNQYAHTAGNLVLRERIAKKIFRLYGNVIDPEREITITPGATYGIYTALTTILHPGDEVIIFEPAYDSYIPNIVVNGAVPVPVALHYPDYRIPWAVVEKKLNEKTKAIIINSPHNPMGTVLKEKDLAELQRLSQKFSFYIISDEVYEHIIFDNLTHNSILKYPQLLERAFAVYSFGKTYHCTGWKIGYCVAPAPLMAEFRKVHQYNCFSVFSPAQAALAAYLKNEEAYLFLGNFLQQKRDLFRELMSGTGFEPIHSSGSYFECYNYSNLSRESDLDFAERLTREKGVAAIPLSSFYHDKTDNKVLRFCFAKKNETLRMAAERLKNI